MKWLGRHKILIGIVLFEVLAVLYAWSYVVPGSLEHYIERKVEESCETCRFKIGGLQMNLLSPGDFRFTNIKFSDVEKGSLEVYADIKSVYFHLSLHQLLKKRLYVRDLDIEGPNVHVIDGDKK